MSILFSVYVNKYNNVHELRNDVVFESKKLAVQVVDKIKNGLTSLLKSISNSFTALKKIFSFSSVIENIKKTACNTRTVASVVIENKTTIGAKSFEYTPSNSFDELKYKMHAKLEIIMSDKLLKNNIN